MIRSDVPPDSPDLHSNTNLVTASSDNVTDPRLKQPNSSAPATVSVHALKPTKHIPSTISLPSIQDISTVTKVTNTALSELTLEELRFQLSIVSNRWRKNQHVSKKAAKQRKRRKTTKAAKAKMLLKEPQDSPMSDKKITRCCFPFRSPSTSNNLI